MSAAWWTRHHNRHHAMPQRINRDVDLDTMPLLAFNAKSVKNSKDGKGFMVQNQVQNNHFPTHIAVVMFALC